MTAAPAHPGHVICDPQAGTVLSGRAKHHYRAWLPTNIKSSYLAGPGTISRTTTQESTVGTTLSASFEVDEGFIFASAKETYGVQLSKSSSRSSSWSYSENVPAHHTARVQQYHRGYEVGIVEHIMEYGNGGSSCVSKKFVSLTGNYFNVHSTKNETYCYALVSKRARPMLGSTCHNRI